MRTLALVSWIITLLCLLIILVLTISYIDPPFTDISQVMFFGARDYLPSKEMLSREEIAPAVTKLLDYERQNYIRIFYLGIGASVGLLGISISRRSRGGTNISSDG
jgi:hypothetical protein